MPARVNGSRWKDGALVAQGPKRSCRKMTSQPHQPKTQPPHETESKKSSRRANQKMELLQSPRERATINNRARRARGPRLAVLENRDLEPEEGSLAAWPAEEGDGRRGGGGFFPPGTSRVFLLPFPHGRQPDTTGATGRQGAAASPIPLPPSGRVHALTRFFLSVRARARSLGEATCALGRRRTRPASGEVARIVVGSGWLAGGPARPLLLLAWLGCW